MVVGWKEIYQTSKKGEKIMEGGRKGKKEEWKGGCWLRDAGVGGWGRRGSPEQLAWSKQSTAFWVNLRCFLQGASQDLIH